MRKITFLLALFFLALNSYGQNASQYSFSQTNGIFSALTTPSILASGSAFDDTTYSITAAGLAGFTFDYAGTNYTAFTVSTNGYMGFGSSLMSSTNDNPLSQSTGGNAFVAPFADDLQGLNTNSQIAWKLEGTAPNRELVIEWSNVRNYARTNVDLTFQVRLEETTNVIKIVYGTMTYTSTTSDGSEVGIKSSTTAGHFNNRTTTTDWNATTTGTLNTAKCNVLNTIVLPVSGLTFTYSPPPPASCAEASSLVATNVLTTTATISWNAPTSAPANGYEYYYSTVNTAPTGATMPSGSVAAGVLTANLSSLTPNTNYYVWVRSNCGIGNFSLWSSATNFFTGYCIPASTSSSTYIDNFSTTNANVNASNLTSGYAATGYQDNYANTTITEFVNGSFDINSTIVGGTLGMAVWVDWNNNLIFETTEVLYSTTSYSSGPFNFSITIPPTATPGDYRMRVMVDYNDSNPGDDSACGFGGTRGEVEDYKLTVLAQPTDAVDFANLQAIVTTNGSVSTIENCESINVYTQGWEAGVTDASAIAAGAGLEVWIGKSNADTDPSTWAAGLWTVATYNTDVGNNDEFVATFTGLSDGTHYFASRWRLNNGPFKYGASNNGFWEVTTNPNASLTVTSPIAITTTADNTTICSGNSVTLTAASANPNYTYIWNDMAMTSGAVLTVSPATTTTYTVTGTNTLTGCTSTSSITINVNPSPTVATITASNNTVCANEIITLSASSSDVVALFDEGFESGFPPTNWLSFIGTNGIGTVKNWTTNSTAHSGSNAAFVDWENVTGGIAEDWLVTPMIDLSNVTSPNLSFYTRQSFTTDYGSNYFIKISTTSQSDPTSFTDEATWTETTLNASALVYEMKSIDLSNYIGQQIYIAFVMTNDDGDSWYIDDVKVSATVQNEVTWSPITNLYSDALATVPYVANTPSANVYYKSAIQITETITSSVMGSNMCESTDATSITVNVTPAPTATAQSFCDSATIADLLATGTALAWYDVATNGSALTPTTALATGDYYVSQTLNSCESERTMVSVTVNITPAPTATAQSFCGSATVADLMATGSALAWYDVATNGTALTPSTALTTGDYYVSQTLNACESERTMVSVTVNSLPTTPTISASNNTACGNEIVTLSATSNDVTPIFTEGFEGGFPPTGWASYIGTNGVGTLYNWTTNTPAYSGLKAAYVRYENVLSGIAEDWLVTPMIDLTSVSNPNLTFYTRQSFGTNYGSNYYVKVSTTSQTNQTTFTNVATWTETTLNTTATVYEMKSVDLSAYAGQQIYIAFVMTNDDGDNWYIDDVSVNETIQNNVTWSPTTYLYSDAAATIPYIANTPANMVYFKSNIQNTETITATATTSALCESTDTTSIIVTVTAVPTATAQTFCNSATVTDLMATGTALAWYNVATNGTALTPATALSTGDYYVTQTLNSCESERVMVSVTVNVVDAPSGSTTQIFCGNANLSDLTAIGTDVKWYNAATNGTEYPNALLSSIGLVNGTTYYASQTINGCEGIIRLAVTAEVNAIPTAPNTTAQTFCNTALVSSLSPSGANYTWYDAATGGNILASTSSITTSGMYYVSQTINGCESATTGVQITINETPAPTGDAVQTFNVVNLSDATVADLMATGSNIVWYASATDAMNGTNPLSSSNQLINGNTYYATQTINGCTSILYLEVTVTVALGNEGFDSTKLKYYPNPVVDNVSISYSNIISSVEVYNLLGQRVIAFKPNATQFDVNIASLEAGTYIVQLESDGLIEKIKLIKK